MYGQRFDSLNDLIGDEYYRNDRKRYLLREMLDYPNRSVQEWLTLYPKISEKEIVDYHGVLYGAKPISCFFRVFSRHYYTKISKNLRNMVENGSNITVSNDDGEFSSDSTHYIFPIPENAGDLFATPLVNLNTPDRCLYIRRTPSPSHPHDDIIADMVETTPPSENLMNFQFYTPKSLLPSAIRLVQQFRKLYRTVQTREIDLIALNMDGEFEIRFHNIIITNIDPTQGYPQITRMVATHSSTFYSKWSPNGSIVYFEYLIEKSLFQNFRFQRHAQTLLCYCKYNQGLIVFEYTKPGLVKIILHGGAFPYRHVVLDIARQMHQMYPENSYQTRSGSTQRSFRSHLFGIVHGNHSRDCDKGTGVLNQLIFASTRKTQQRKLTQREMKLMVYSLAYNILNPSTLRQLRRLKLPDILPHADRDFLQHVTRNGNLENCHKKRIDVDNTSVSTYSRYAHIQPLAIDNIVIPVCTEIKRDKASKARPYNFFKTTIQTQGKYDLTALPSIHRLIGQPYLVETQTSLHHLGFYIMWYRLRYPNLLIPVFNWTQKFVSLDNIATAHINARCATSEPFVQMKPLFVNENEKYPKIRTTLPEMVPLIDDTKNLVDVVMRQIEYNSNTVAHEIVADCSRTDNEITDYLSIYVDDVSSKFYGLAFHLRKEPGEKLGIHIVPDENYRIYIIRRVKETQLRSYRCHYTDGYNSTPLHEEVQQVHSGTPLQQTTAESLIEEFHNTYGKNSSTAYVRILHADELSQENYLHGSDEIICILGSPSSPLFANLVLGRYTRWRTHTDPQKHPILAVDNEFDVAVVLHCIRHTCLETAAKILARKKCWTYTYHELVQFMKTWTEFTFQWIGFHNQIKQLHFLNCHVCLETDLARFIRTMKLYEKTNDLSIGDLFIDKWRLDTFKRCVFSMTKRLFYSLPSKSANIRDNIEYLMKHAPEYDANSTSTIRERIRIFHKIWRNEKRAHEALQYARNTTNHSFAKLTKGSEQSSSDIIAPSVVTNDNRNVRKRHSSTSIADSHSTNDHKKRKTSDHTYEDSFIAYLNRRRSTPLIGTVLFSSLFNNSNRILFQSATNTGGNYIQELQTNDVPVSPVREIWMSSALDSNERAQRSSTGRGVASRSLNYGGNLLHAFKDLQFIFHPAFDHYMVIYTEDDRKLTPMKGHSIFTDDRITKRSDSFDDLYGVETTERVTHASTRFTRSGFANSYRVPLKTKFNDRFQLKESSFCYNL